MSTANPTHLRLGSTGMIDGRRLTVAGRAVMSTRVDGTTYYWNEFNVVDAANRAGTLVYEDDAAGPEWKLFRRYEPSCPLTADEAGRVDPEDLINLGGTPARVTLVGQSRVEQVEDEPPEGVAQGDTADYFNADCTSGSRLLVASWTGDEIEFFEGENLQMTVQADGSFVGSRKSRSQFNNHASSSSPGTAGKAIVAVAMSAFMAFFIFGIWKAGEPATNAPPPVRTAPALRLNPGSRGVLAGTTYTITNHALVEVADVAGKFQRHEYPLVGPDGPGTLLVQGLGAGAHEWHLLTPVDPPQSFNALVAATRKPGQMLAVAGHTYTVSGLFLSRTMEQDGTPDAMAAPDLIRYGFVAQSNGNLLVARWTQFGLQLHLGVPLTEAEVLAALGPGAQ